MVKFWDKTKQFFSDFWDYLNGLKTFIYMTAIALMGVVEEVGIDQLVPPEHVGKAMLLIAFGGVVLRFVTKGPVKGMK